MADSGSGRLDIGELLVTEKPRRAETSPYWSSYGCCARPRTLAA